MKLKCTASIGTIYWKVNEKSAEGLKSKRDSSSNYFVHDGNPPPPGMYLLTYSTVCPTNVRLTFAKHFDLGRTIEGVHKVFELAKNLAIKKKTRIFVQSL